MRMPKCPTMDTEHEERSDQRILCPLKGRNNNYRKLPESSKWVYSSCYIITCLLFK
ncbi:hypothetical protein EG68_02898, partial [Paragonimus skrjabini miyazakii]